MAWCWPGDKPLSEPMMFSLQMCICITQSQRVKTDLGIFTSSCSPGKMQCIVGSWPVGIPIVLHRPLIVPCTTLKTLRPKHNERHFADDIFKCISLNENVWIPIKISLKFVPKGPINHIPSLAQIMAWRRPGDKPLSETMMVRLLTHICVTRPQWVKTGKLPLRPCLETVKDYRPDGWKQLSSVT